MITEKELIQRLNLLKLSRFFVLHEIGEHGEADVLRVNKIPPNNGIYWIPGDTVLKNGVTLDSVFQVDTSSGGSVLSVYWWINGRWYDQNDIDTIEALGLARSEIFPYDWKYHIPLSVDIYHD